jgi:hypothetical protein
MGLNGPIPRESCGSGHQMAGKAAAEEWAGMADRCRFPSTINRPLGCPSSERLSRKTGYSSQVLNVHRCCEGQRQQSRSGAPQRGTAAGLPAASTG